MLYTVLTVVHVVVCTFLILVVLLQAGKGGGMGIAFGGGGSQTVFGSSGAGNFLTRLTAIFAAIFFVNSLVLAYLSSQQDSKRLQGLAEKKAAEKKVQTDIAAKITKDLEAARQAAEKGEKGATPAPAATTTEASPTPAPKTESAPAEAEAPAGEATKKAEPAKPAPVEIQIPPKPTAPPKSGPAPPPQ